MLPYFSKKFGNPSSVAHSYGWLAAAAVKTAREQVAALIHCQVQELIFTSGASEAINQALKGVYEIYASKGNHIITCATEHRAVLDTCRSLEDKGARVTCLSVNKEGLIDLQELRDSISDKTILVCLQMANNETGVIQPMVEIAEVVHAAGSIFMSDATQAVGKIPVDVQGLGIDLLCLSAHKFCGPKGAGALYVRRKNPRVKLYPLIHGGGQEGGLRSGTLNVPAIVGLGKAAEIAMAEMKSDALRISNLRELLEQALLFEKEGKADPVVLLNGSPNFRLPGISNLRFANFTSSELIVKLQPIAFSAGSACSSANGEPSHVLLAMGLDSDQARRSVRFGLGKATEKNEIEMLIERIRLLGD